jgi:hypothetical protein
LQPFLLELAKYQQFCTLSSLHHAQSSESNEGHEGNQEAGSTRRQATNEGNEGNQEGNQEAVGQLPCDGVPNQ